MDLDLMDEKGVDPLPIVDGRTLSRTIRRNRHLLTGADYVEFYKEIITSEGAEAEIISPTTPPLS